MIYINQSAIKKDEREINVKGQVITWDHLLEQQYEIVFHTFQTAVDYIELLLPEDIAVPVLIRQSWSDGAARTSPTVRSTWCYSLLTRTPDSTQKKWRMENTLSRRLAAMTTAWIRFRSPVYPMEASAGGKRGASCEDLECRGGANPFERIAKSMHSAIPSKRVRKKDRQPGQANSTCWEVLHEAWGCGSVSSEWYCVQSLLSPAVEWEEANGASIGESPRSEDGMLWELVPTLREDEYTIKTFNYLEQTTFHSSHEFDVGEGWCWDDYGWWGGQ